MSRPPPGPATYAAIVVRHLPRLLLGHSTPGRKGITVEELGRILDSILDAEAAPLAMQDLARRWLRYHHRLVTVDACDRWRLRQVAGEDRLILARALLLSGVGPAQVQAAARVTADELATVRRAAP